MSGRDKIALVVITLALVWFSFEQRKHLVLRIKEMKEKIEEINPKREALEVLSGTRKRLLELRKNFENKYSGVPLQQMIYSTARDCGVKVLVVVPSKKEMSANLLSESLLVKFESTYNNLLCFISHLESAKKIGFVYVSDLSILRRDTERSRGEENLYYGETRIHRILYNGE